ncbi:MAG: response regulator [Dehalococcoidia bacterium]
MTDLLNPRPVAVLDDDVQFIRMVERILKTDGLQIQPVTTPDLDEAARVVAMTNCRVALVDIYMYGEAAGFELIERLRQQPMTANLPLIVTSGAYREIARHVPFLQHHRCSILPKPFEVDALISQIHHAHAGDAPLQTPAPEESDEWSDRHPGSWRFLANPLRRVERTA